ncbi:hypothetical protein [Actinomadura sp. KC345]|nr:hypothetical protein [Actinomadura sp. KC345]
MPAWGPLLLAFHNTPAQYHGRPDLADQHTDELSQVLRATSG